MFSSVRIRLTLWYTAGMTVVLVALAFVTYFLLEKNAMHRTDAAAVEQADSFLKTVNAEISDPSGPESLQSGLEAAISEHRFRDTLFLVVDDNGKILAFSGDQAPPSDAGSVEERPSREALRQIAEDRQTHRNVRLGRHRFRSFVRKFTVERQDCTLFVLQSLHPQQEFLDTVSGTFALVIPLAVILASSGGYFLARRSLAPVATMGLQASRIGADNLHERLPVQDAKDELGHLALSFNGLLDRLDSAFDQQRRFVADASHELRTPVAILCGESDVTLSRSDRTPEEYRESLAILGAEARRMRHIIEDLFTLARADAGQHPLTPSDFYLDELASECVRNLRTLAAARQVSLHGDQHKEMLVHADESLLRRMIVNLIDNAIKHTPAGGEVRVSCQESESEYVLVVNDTGEGIPPDLQSKVFERFFRADKARTRFESGGGAGLGLSISRWIAQAHGGRLELTSSEPGATTFTVFVPKSTQ